MAIDLITEHIRLKLRQHDLIRIYSNLEVGRRRLDWALRRLLGGLLRRLLRVLSCYALPGKVPHAQCVSARGGRVPSLAPFPAPPHRRLTPPCLTTAAPHLTSRHAQVMPSNFQMRGMHTILRDRDTSPNDFVFYADRINRLLVEAGLGHLPFREKTVMTPTGEPGGRG